MSDDESREAIRQRKREKLMSETTDSPDTGESPTEPVHVHGPDDLTETVQNHDVVLTDFHADWCGPCKMLEPIVNDLATESGVTVAKIDVDANQGLAQQYGVQGVPTMILFADGEPVERIVGVKDKETLAGTIRQYQ